MGGKGSLTVVLWEVRSVDIITDRFLAEQQLYGKKDLPIGKPIRACR
jgi:hypothetical protein